MNMQPIQVSVEDVFGELPTLETERLLLRKLRPEDAEDMYEYGRDPEVARYVMWEPHKSVEDSAEFINWAMAQYMMGQVAPWGIEYRAEGKLIGSVGYHDWNTVHARAEIGYSLGRAYWNRGIMTEALRAVVAFGFRIMHLNRIEARCIPENTASARVMEKCGMVYEGTLREQNFVKGRFDDMQMYSILKREWIGNRAVKG
jgi:[ribosomal protein S5]-alanine N-acetyltransferase